uniref:ZP domain-containing protein n=1 Tax=Romanomermis culicivorax TaxID=13658 RepID=A0A915IVX0_ROMCU
MPVLFLYEIPERLASISRDPIINCTEHGIRFQVNTRLPFNGRIFAQGKVEDADCVKVYSEGSVGSYDNGDRGSSTKPFMDLGFETCGMDAVVSLRATIRSIDDPPPQKSRLTSLGPHVAMVVHRRSICSMSSDKTVMLGAVPAAISEKIDDLNDLCICIAPSVPILHPNAREMSSKTEPHGIYFSVKLTVSFHRLLITKNDKFFKAKCFFAETRTSISQRLEVRNSDPIEYLTSHHTSPCNYAMYNASYGTFEGHRDLGPPLTYAQVGDRILHVWSCPDHFYGIMVYDCYVTDGYLQNLTVVDDKGCSSNYELVSNVRYGRGLHEAYAESQVFKFAEKPVVYFHCRIEECDLPSNYRFQQPHCDYNHHPSTKLAPIDAAPPAFNPSRSGPYSGDVPVTDGFSQQLLRSDNFVESASVDSFTASEESTKMNLKRLQKFSLTLLDNPLDGEKIGISVRNNQQNRLSNRLLQQQRSTKQPIFQNVKGHLIVLDSGEETKTLPVRKSQKEEEFE